MTTHANQTDTNLIWVRAGARAALALGVAASVAANVLHAQPNLVGRAIAAWSPLALLLTVELISRVPVHRPVLSVARMTATAAIAGIAAWVSYWHMVSVAIRYGETTDSAHLLPLSVDGLVVVASVSLVEISSRLRAIPAHQADQADQADQATEPVAATDEGDTDAAAGAVDPRAAPTVEQETQPPAPAVKPAARKRGKPAGRTSAPAAVRRLAAAHPDWTMVQIAAKAGCSPRTARRHLTGERGNASPEAAPAERSHDVDREGEEAA